jgi:hypothetical protein
MSPAADSAGQPFEGRSFQSNPFAGDDGQADEALASALADFQGFLADVPDTGLSTQLAAVWGRVIEALRGARVLSPLIAHAGDYGLTEAGLVVEKTQELSVVHLEGPDGRTVAPVFSDVAAMQRWRAEARPIPVSASQAALAAAGDGLSVMVLNPGSDNSVTLRRGAIRALASGEAYTPAWVDEQVAAAIGRGIDRATHTISRHRILPGDVAQVLQGPEVVVAVGLQPGLSQDQVESLVAEISLAWSTEDVLANYVDGLGVKVLPI